VVSKIKVVPEEERASESCLPCESMIWFSSTSRGREKVNVVADTIICPTK
jgi:hypothetical protein